MAEGPIPHSVLRSLAGASPDQVIRALGADGLLRRPLPPGRKGFRMLSPGKMPGAQRSLSFLPGGCGFRTFGERPPPPLFVLNKAAEQTPLTEALQTWAGTPGRHPGEHVADIPVLAAAARNLVQDGLVRAYLDDLASEELTLLEGDRALRELADPLNWWRDEDDPDVPPADHLIVLDITDQGQRALAAA